MADLTTSIPILLAAPAAVSVVRKLVEAFLIERRHSSVEIKFSDSKSNMVVAMSSQADVETLAAVLAQLGQGTAEGTDADSTSPDARDAGDG